MIKQIKKKITFDDEICCSWTYKNVPFTNSNGDEYITDIHTSVSIHKMNIKGCYMTNPLNKIFKYRNEKSFSEVCVCDEHWGTIYIKMDNGIITLSLFDLDSYDDETDYFYEDGLQEGVDFIFTKKQSKQFFCTIEKLLND